MKKLIWSFASLLVLGLHGCIPSFHPLYTDDTLVFREDLLGVWQGEDEDRWVFTRRGDRFYALAHTDENGKTGYFEAGLVRLGDHYFFDLFPGQKPKATTGGGPLGKTEWFFEGDDELIQFHLLPVHTFARVRWTGENVHLEWLGSEWLDNLLDERRIRIRYEQSDGRRVLTASTRELQKFLTKYGAEDRAFTELAVLSKNGPN